MAISEGGPDAEPSFRLAAALATTFGGTVDAVHFTEDLPHDSDIANQSMPFLARLSRERLVARAEESRRVYKALVAGLPGATFSGDKPMTRDQLVHLGRFAGLVVIGRPGSDPENVAPETVKAALYESARPVVIAPPRPGAGSLGRVVIAWNGSAPAARAVGAAMPFLRRAGAVTVLATDAAREAVGAPLLVRLLARHGIAATVETVKLRALTGRGRGRALLAEAVARKADLLVMGAYGHGELSNFLGLGGATAKVISSCPMPLLLAR
jgi:nucleotide-binding universal stress UspA family protein